MFNLLTRTGVFFLVLLTVFSGVRGYGPLDSHDYDQEDSESTSKETREFMIPYPRLGRYMDYAVLKVLAEYLKDNYQNNNGLQLGRPVGDQLPTIGNSDIVLQRELRDMKGKGYGIPIPRVGRRSVPESSAGGGGEQIQLAGLGLPIANESVRSLLADLLRATSESNSSKRQPSTTRLMQFTPRVGRAYNRPKSAKYSNWAPIPRVGKRR